MHRNERDRRTPGAADQSAFFRLQIRISHRSDSADLVRADRELDTDRHRRAILDRLIGTPACPVAEVEGRAVGYALLTDHFFGQPFIELLYIAEPHRRKGLGLLLMRHLIDSCPPGKLFTSTNASNLPMQALLSRLGFIPSGRIENLDEGDPELVYMLRIEQRPTG